MTDPARFLRQVLLPEIGEAGQRRLEAATAAVAQPDGGGEGALGHEVASAYALGAGFASVTPGPIDRAALAPEAIVATPAAREVLAGARAALAAMRSALDSTEEPG
jgi:hypothetical protein